MFSVDLPSERTAAALARRFVRETIAPWGVGDDVVDDAELLVSELVTNAVLHAHSPSHLTIARRNGRVRIAVADQSAAPPRLRDYGPEAVTGRGLLLVDRIARDWGVEIDRAGKSVWFELDLASHRRDQAGGVRI